MIIESIKKKEALRYLGIKGEPDSKTAELIDVCEKELLKVIEPKFLFRKFEIAEASDGVDVGGDGLFLSGEGIKKHLAGCKSAVLMCATLGQGVDRLIRQLQITDLAKAVIIDALASSATEQLCDYVEKEIRSSAESYHLTTRFSPGYDDLPIAIQKEFLSLLSAQKKIGLCSTDSLLLTPRKSVTAIIGLSDKKTRKYKSCDNCNLKDTCGYRKDNNHCGK